MNTELEQMLVRAKRQQRQNSSRVQRLISLLDLTPPLDEEALRKEVQEELRDQHDMLVSALSCVQGSEPALLLLRQHPEDIPAQALRHVLPTLNHEGRVPLAEGLQRYERFRERLGWLLQPDTF